MTGRRDRLGSHNDGVTAPDIVAAHRLPWFLFAVPQRVPTLVARPRLAGLLDGLLREHPLVIVAAPSGYGKTTFVAEWARSQQSVSWMSASDGQDPGAQIDELVERTAVLARDAATPVVIIDEAHLLDPGVLGSTLTSDAALASGAIRVVLVGKPMLARQYARARGGGRAAMIGADQLAFTADEVGRVMAGGPIEASAASVESVRASTGGWPIAVHLLARAKTDRTPRSLTGADPADVELTDFVEDLLESQLSSGLLDFVLASTTCTRLDVDLAQALSGRADAAALLEECRGSGLFLDARLGEGGRSSYVWHEVFARHCRIIAWRRSPASARANNLIAARLLASRNPAAAADHALAASDAEFAARIIERGWIELLVSGQAETLDALCLRLPEEVRDRTALLAIRACCRDLLGDATAAELLRRRLGSPEPAAADTASFAELLLASDPVRKAQALEGAVDAMNALGESTYPHGVFLVGWSELRLRRNPERAVTLLRSARDEAARRDLATTEVQAVRNLAFAEVYAGHFTDGRRTLASISPDRMVDAFRWAEYDADVVAFAEIYIHFWEGDLADAMTRLQDLMSAGSAASGFGGLARVYLALATAALRSHQDVPAARAALAEMPDQVVQGVPWPSYRRFAEARLILLEGDAERARQHAVPLLRTAHIPVTHALLAEFFAEQNQPSLALLALRRIDRTACPSYAWGLALVVAATLDQRAGNHRRARSLLARALEMTDAEGVDYPFLSHNEALRGLLGEMAHSGSPFEARIARVLSAKETSPTAWSALTARERELLAYLRTSMTAQEIADALAISLPTVRTHMRSIYRKLGVPNRREAIRAVPEGSIPPTGARADRGGRGGPGQRVR